MDAKYNADTSIADSSRAYQMKKASFDIEVNARVSFTLTAIRVDLKMLQQPYSL